MEVAGCDAIQITMKGIYKNVTMVTLSNYRFNINKFGSKTCHMSILYNALK